MARIRRGISPVLAVVLLTGIVLVMSVSTYMFISGSQDVIFAPANDVELRTINLTCTSDRVVWWIENTDESPVEGEADLYIGDSSGINTSLTRTGLTVDAGFTEAQGTGQLNVSLTASMAADETYDLELSFSNAGLLGRCQIGGPWWDPDYDHRRQVSISSGHSRAVSRFPASVTLDTATLIANDKMADDCRDVRVVEDGTRVPHSVEACDTGSTRINFTTDVAAGATEDDINLYYGNPAASRVNVSTVPTRIVNGDFEQGWTGWSKSPDTGGGTTEFWLDEWPDDGTCTGPQSGTSDGPCGEPAANVTLLSSGTGDAQCSPGSGCPTPVVGDGVLALDGGADGSGYNGNIRSDTVEVPGGVHLHWWHNLQGRSSDGGRYDGSTRWNGTVNATSSTEGEGVAWAVVVDGDDDNDLDTADWIFRQNISGGDNHGATQDFVEETVVDVSGLAGDNVRLYIEDNHGGGGDDGLIQVDDMYWSDASGTEITLSSSVGAEQTR